MIRRSLIAIVALLSILAFAGCGGTNATTRSTTNSTGMDDPGQNACRLFFKLQEMSKKTGLFDKRGALLPQTHSILMKMDGYAQRTSNATIRGEVAAMVDDYESGDYSYVKVPEEAINTECKRFAPK